MLASGLLLTACASGASDTTDAPEALEGVSAQAVEAAPAEEATTQATSQPTEPAPTEPAPTDGPVHCTLDDAETVCGDGAFCLFADETCGEADPGVCTPIPEMCTMQFDPVCGCDGEEYGNACGAYSAGQSIRVLGTCDGSAPF